MRAVAALALLWGAAYLTWRIGWSGRGAAPVPYWILIGAELYGFVSLALYAWGAWRVPAVVRPFRKGSPSVDIFVCTYDEPLRVVEATLAGCRAISYRHTTYLLDDGHRPEMAELAIEMGARYVSRPDNMHAKAGNINHALGCTDGDLILALDADHVPHPDILQATLGYFDDPLVGLVQTPHDFSNRDSMQHTKPGVHEQSLFYEILAPGKDRVGAMFWCGSAAVIRREALLSVGGVQTKTVAEDFHTTIALHSRGWRSRYHHETLVQGLAPHDLAAFLLQRERWARGNLRVFRTRENPVWCPGLTLRQRLSYLASLANYFSGLQRLLLLGVLVNTLVSGRLPMSASPTTLAIFWAPWAMLSFVATLALARGTLAPSDSSVYGLETMGIYLRALVALVWPGAGRFKVTPKEGIDEGGFGVLRVLGLLSGVTVLLVGAVGLRALTAVGVVGLPPLEGLALAVTLVVGVWELAFIARTLVPLVRRKQHRVQYRFPVELRGRIASSIVDVLDLAPDGLAFRSPVEWPVGERTELLTRLPSSDGVLADLTLRLVVRSARRLPDQEGWRIGCSFADLDTASRRVLVEYCYVVQQADRTEPGRPVQVRVASRRPDGRDVRAS
ncbi:MAG: glycosyltransferase family 2 protein [Acidimicrobiia bacterium]